MANDSVTDVESSVNTLVRFDRRAMMRPRPLSFICLVIVAAVVAGVPSFASPYVVNLLTLTVITALPVVSLTVLFGYAGQISLGQAAFYGLGAYGYANLTAKQKLSPWLAILIAVLIAAFVAYLMGRALLRLRGYYLAMVTAALGLIAVSIFSNATTITGGYSGIAGIPTVSFGAFDISSRQAFFYFAVVVVLIVLIATRLLASGEYGRILKTMRESETLCASFGISVARTKAQIFALSAALAALGGCLFAQYLQYVSPDNFGADLSVNLFLGAVIGGLTSIWGALVGSAYIILLPEAVSGHASFEILITGAITLLVLRFAPNGVVGLVRESAKKLAQEMRGRYGKADRHRRQPRVGSKR